MDRAIQSAFRALADPTRRQILRHLSTSDMTIAEVAAQFDMTRAAIKKHLIVLEQGCLISVHINGRERINRLEPAGLSSIVDWLNYFNPFWDDKLGNLASAIEKHDRQQKETTND